MKDAALNEVAERGCTVGPRKPVMLDPIEASVPMVAESIEQLIDGATVAVLQTATHDDPHDVREAPLDISQRQVSASQGKQ